MNKTAKMAVNEKGERVIQIQFEYNLDTLIQVRELPGRKYYPDWHYWSTPLNIETLNTLLHWQFTIDDSLQKYMEKVKNRSDKILRDGIPDLKGTLFPFQAKGISFVEAHDGRALIADEMGLGKTIQAIGWMQLHRDKIPVVIVCPASLKFNWQNEIEKWMPDPSIEVLSGTKTHIPKKDIVIINYDILFAWTEILQKINPKILIFDEVHKIKSSKAHRTKASKKLAKNIPHIIALSGTPILNRPIEIYNAITMIDSSIFPNYRYFVQQYCNYHFNGFGWDANGASNTDELHEKLNSSLMIRRLKKDVMPELPDKIFSFVPMEIKNQKEYNEAENDFIKFITEQKGLEAAKRVSNAVQFAKIEALKQLTIKGKLDDCIEWIEDFLETDNKLVVFAWHTEVINTLLEKFAKLAVKFDGKMTATEKENSKISFMNDPKSRLFIGQIATAGEGITLTVASNLAFIELPYTPGGLDQCIDRLHRIGQKECVNVHYLLAKGTIEEKIAHLIDKKRQTFDAVLDGKETEQNSMLTEIMKLYE